MPDINIPNKICPHCGGTLYYHNIKKNSYYCKVKQIERSKAYIQSPGFKEANRKRSIAYAKANKEKVAENARIYYNLNKEKCRATMKKYNQSEAGKEVLRLAKNKQSENLTDYYIVNIIYSSMYSTKGVRIDRKAVTPEQIERYRKHIQLQRQTQQTSFKTRNHGKNIESKKSKQITKN